MIARLLPEERRNFLAMLERDPLLGGQIATALDCWQGKEEHCGFYRIDTSAALLVQGGGALLCGGLTQQQGEKLAVFLRFSGVRGLTARTSKLPGWQAKPLFEMQAEPGTVTLALPPKGTRICTDPPLWPLRESGLLPDGVDPDGWYADTCVRRVRGFAKVWTIERAGRPIAAAGLYSMRGEPFGGYLSGVFTLPGERGKGCACALVTALAAASPCPVRLLCTPALADFYRLLGFVQTGRMFALCPKEQPV